MNEKNLNMENERKEKFHDYSVITQAVKIIIKTKMLRKLNNS
jgi:hypothetical protein